MKIWLLLFFLYPFFSCQPSFVCDPTTNQSSVNISILTYKKGSPLIINTKAVDSSYNQDFFKIYAKNSFKNSIIKTDSVLYQDSLKMDTLGYSNLSLPLSNKVDSVTYYFIVNTTPHSINNTLDTTILTINYASKLHYISQGCGYEYYYTITKFSINYKPIKPLFFYPITLLTNQVNTSGTSNFKFYHLP